MENALKKKGFEQSNRDHKKFTYHTFEGEKTSIWTKISHGTSHKDISRDNLKKMARQCRLDLESLHDLIDCPLSREEYQKIQISSGDIRTN